MEDDATPVPGPGANPGGWTPDLLAGIPEAALVVRGEHVVAANDAARALLGDVLERRVTEVLPGSSLPDGQGSTDIPLDDRVLEVVFGREQADGRLLLVRDATDARRHAIVVDHVADTVMVLDRDGVLRWRSENSQLWTGVPHEDVLGSRHLSRLHPEDIPAALQAIDELFEHPGERIEMLARGRSLADPDTWEQVALRGIAVDEPCLSGVLVDATILRSGIRPDPLTRTAGASIAELTPIGIVICSASGETVYGNQAAHALLGPDFDPVLGSSWTDGFADRDRVRAEEVMRDAIRGETPPPFVVHRTDTPGNHWLRVVIRGQTGPGGAAHSLIATLEDISAEMEARLHAHRLEALLDATDDLVASFDAEGALIWANATVRELLDQHETDLAQMLGAQGADVIAEASQALVDSGRWRRELTLTIGDEIRTFSVLGIGDRVPDAGYGVLVIARDITRLKEVEAELRTRATHDPLTGLANRSLFVTELERALVRRPPSSGVGVLFADLDGFKAINDELGHASGDWLLELVADRLRAATRAEDLVARVGGDEFAVLMLDPDLDQLRAAAERVAASVGQPVDWLPDLRFGISVGAAYGPAGAGVDATQLLHHADEAMYRAKREGNAVEMAW